MSSKQIRYFKWNDKFDHNDYKLGDSIAELLHKDLIYSIDNDGEIQYRVSGNPNIWILGENGVVERIFYTNEEGCAYLKFDPWTFEYPATEKIVEHLSQEFEPVPEEDYKSAETGDFMILMFRDFIPNNMMIRRKDLNL